MNRRALLSALASLTVACSATEPPVVPHIVDAGPATGVAVNGVVKVAEVEPNDTLQNAQVIAQSAEVSGKLSPVQPATRPDEDWYAVAPKTAQQDLAITLTAAPVAGTTYAGKLTLEVYDGDHNKLMAQTGAGPLAIPAVRVRDRIYVRVAGQPVAYAMELKLSPPDPDREAEPNNRPVDATPLPLDHPMKGTYGTEGDQDFYVVELIADAAPAAPAPAASATTGAAPIAMPTGATTAAPAPTATATGTGGSTPTPVTVPTATGTASPTPPTAPPTPTTPPSSAPPTTLLRVDITGIPGIRHSLMVFDDNQVPFAEFLGKEAGAPLAVRDLPLRPGMARVTLLLQSAPQKKKARPASDQPYTITVKREPAPADMELEPNELLSQATPIATHRVGWLAPEGDVDVYRLHLDAAARVHVLLSALDRVDTELSVLDLDPKAADKEKGSLILKVNEGGTKEPEVIPALALGPGDHYIKVQAAAHQVGTKWVRDQFDPDQTYSLDVTTAPDDGSFEKEPNDTAASATPITPGKALSGYLFPAKDVDVFKLDLSAAPVPSAATITATGVTKIPLVLEVHASAPAGLGELINSADPGKPGMEAVVHEKLAPGVYYLVVHGKPQSKATGAPQADADTTYKLTVTME